MKEILMECTINLKDFAYRFSESHYCDDIFELIKLLDDMVADYDFTLRLKNHFSDIIKKIDEGELKK